MAAGGNVVSEKENKRLDFTVEFAASLQGQLSCGLLQGCKVVQWGG